MTHIKEKEPHKTFPIKQFISDLPSDILPQPISPSSKNSPGSRRLVIIGDIHGMRNSFEALLDKVGFDRSKGDHLILVGDLVNKGPDSPGVVDLAIKLGASAVRGNHENAVLDAAAEIKAQSASTHSETTHKTALELSEHQLNWLAALPLILRIKIPYSITSSFGDTILVAHAGLVPGIPLEEQDPHAVMHMRSLDCTPTEDKFVPAEAFGEEGWAVKWDCWQQTQVSKSTVIFGHDAKRQLQLGTYYIGLDSSCLYGHRLSALVIEACDGGIKHHIFQVECADEPLIPIETVKEGERKVTK